MEEQLAKDLKAAMLGGDKTKTEVLKGLKNALQYEAVALGAQDQGLSDEQIQKVLAREAKKRAEAAELYSKAGESQRAAAETNEKVIIDSYLPDQIDEGTIAEAVREVIAELDSPSLQSLGQIIGTVRQNLGPGADGSLIANIARNQLEKK